MPAFDKRIGDFEAANTQVLGISTDSPFSHENWAKAVGISRYPLLSDVQRSVVKSYGVYWPDWNANVRATFVVDPRNLPLVTPPAFHLRLLSPPAPMSASSVYDFALAWLGIPLRWRAFVREFDPPHRFVDVQVRGPYARWEHRHRFLEAGGGTWVEDRVTYRLPLGPLGRAAHALLVRRQLAGLWAYRDRRLAELVAPLSSSAG